MPAVSATAQCSSSINTLDHSLHAADGAVTIALTQQPGGTIKVALIVTASPRQPTQTARAAAIDSPPCESPPGIPPAETTAMAAVNSTPAGAPAPDLQRMPGHAADTAAEASPSSALAAHTEPCTGQPAAEPAISPTQDAPTAESTPEATTDHERPQSPSQMSCIATTTSPALLPAGATRGADITPQEGTAAGTPHSAKPQQPSSTDTMQGLDSTQHSHEAGPSPQQSPAAAPEGVAAAAAATAADTSTAAGSTQPQAVQTAAAAPQRTSVAAAAEAGVTQTDHAPSALPATAQKADDSPPAAAAADSSSTDRQVISCAGRTLVFYGPPACGLCGLSGHAANNCSIPFCFKCNVFGHTPGRYCKKQPQGLLRQLDCMLDKNTKNTIKNKTLKTSGH